MIKTIKTLALAAAVTLLLAACSDATQSAEWYIQNTGEQAKSLEDCNTHPDKSKTQNCLNVYEAEKVIGQGTEAIKKYLADKGLTAHGLGQ